jgi:hypothetical protein
MASNSDIKSESVVGETMNRKFHEFAVHDFGVNEVPAVLGRYIARQMDIRRRTAEEEQSWKEHFNVWE